ncbi:hypothetical protein QR680_002184 [Steinernema hermaphroditum]|uniref:Oligopeptide transporter 1 n=1 Tax=Steinernema hermaphroditum TaxID=289476 RepID=A0AA39LHQ8_9BILA|nr:hypothetical protein QR680_002184 [Steinernema hermaphroditum]
MRKSVGSCNESSECGSQYGRPAPKQATKEYNTWPEMIKHWPKTTFCIVSNEFCERFSYYGMRTVLTLYVANILRMNDQDSTVFFNAFTVLCYFTPILGSIIADGYIGKFWTIFSVSILYAAGQIMLAIAAMQPLKSALHPGLDIAGLAIIGFGTGGIKPCVSAFGGDQFELGQNRMISLYFSVFYFSINAGSMISTFVSPMFRAQPCMGEDSCYPLAFGIPAILMVVSCIVFMAGSWWYKKPPPTENVVAEVSKTIGRALVNKVKGGQKRDHWLECYLNTHRCESDAKCQALRARKGRDDKQFIEDVKSLLRVLIMYLPVPVFWALYDQQGSVWLFQSLQMDCQVGTYLLLPDQMQTVNAVLILVFIPIFQIIVYPIFSKICNVTPLRKMVVGGFIAALAFVISGLVQLSINKTLPNIPEPGHTNLAFVNTLSGCNVTIHSLQNNANYTLPAGGYMMDDNWSDIKQTFKLKATKATFNLDYVGSTCPAGLDKTITADLTGKKIQYVTLTANGYYLRTVNTEKPKEGNGEFKFSMNIATNKPYGWNMALCRRDPHGKSTKCDSTKPSDFVYWEHYDGQNYDIDSENTTILHGGKPSGLNATGYAYKSVRPGKWELFYLHNVPRDINRDTQAADTTSTNVTFEIERQGGVYIMTLTGDVQKPNFEIYQPVPDNTVNILWQLPQITVITIAEILFSITGYDFSYSQAAPSMKSLVQALWLLTTAVGDSIILIVAAANLFENMATEFFVYAALMAGVIIIFMFMCIFYYEYHNYTDAEEEEDDYYPSAIDNEGYVDTEKPAKYDF